MTSQNQHSAISSVTVGVIGLTHTHVHWIFGSEKMGDIKIVGIVEANLALAERYANQHGFSMDIVYPSMSAMIEATHPEGVAAFGSIFEHLEIVKTAAPLGIHVMVEKPLAVSLDHAHQMASLAQKHNIHLLTNYETTWYPSNHKARELIQQNAIGAVKKVIVRDGHKGPKKIGLNTEFLDWLIDPALNGGGAMPDFGCYGINLMTWLLQGQKPNRVTAVTQQLQAENNPLVEDDSTILLTYESANATVQGSWNWPIGRKDMEIYGERGVIYADNRNQLRLRIAEGYDGYHETLFNLEERHHPYHDPFALFAAVIRNRVSLGAYALSSLENNMVVMSVLDAAAKSARDKKAVMMK